MMTEKEISGLGRGELVRLIVDLQAEVSSLIEQRDRALHEARELNDNLTATQARCTQLLIEYRTLKSVASGT